MVLPNIKELRSILKLCREQGVADIKLGDMEIKFGDLPGSVGTVEEDANPHNLTEEQMLFYSVDPLAPEANQ